MELNYKQTLEKARELGIDVLKLEVACEMKYIFDETLCDEDFELCCNFVKQAYLKSEKVTIYNLCIALETFINANIEEKTIKTMLEEMSFYDLIDEAIWYE